MDGRPGVAPGRVKPEASVGARFVVKQHVKRSWASLQKDPTLTVCQCLPHIEKRVCALEKKFYAARSVTEEMELTQKMY